MITLSTITQFLSTIMDVVWEILAFIKIRRTDHV